MITMAVSMFDSNCEAAEEGVEEEEGGAEKKTRLTILGTLTTCGKLGLTNNRRHRLWKDRVCVPLTSKTWQRLGECCAAGQ